MEKLYTVSKKQDQELTVAQIMNFLLQNSDLDYCDIKWIALETNRDHSVIFEVASKYCILDSLVDHDWWLKLRYINAKQ